MGLTSLSERSLFPKLEEKPLKKQQKLGNGISESEDGGRKVILLSLKAQVVP